MVTLVHTVMEALREPVTFADREDDPRTLALLAGGASVGIAGYGAAIHGAEGGLAMVLGAARALATAGSAWALSIPALLVLGALAGSKVSWRKATFASLVTVNFGGLAFLASAPVVTLIELSSPFAFTRPLVNALVVLGVGGSSTLVFERAMAHLEGTRPLHRLFMAVFGVLFVELAVMLGLFQFGA